MDTGTEVMNIDEMDAIVAAFNADDNEALMEASGQACKVRLVKLVYHASTSTTMQRQKTVSPSSWLLEDVHRWSVYLRR
jgi:hypothetical protein